MAIKLGVPHRVLAQAKGFASNLVDMRCKVLAPDLSVFAELPMLEVPGFSGLYSAVLETSPENLEGTYIARCYSISNKFMDDHRLEYGRSAEISVTLSVESLANEIKALQKIVTAIRPANELRVEVMSNTRRGVPGY